MSVSITKNTDELNTLQEAAQALQERDKLQAALRASDSRLRTLCRAYDRAAGVWGCQPHHLAQACKARGML